MVALAMAVGEDRARGVTVLIGTVANVDGNQFLEAALPVGFGDVQILDIVVRADRLATLMVNAQQCGPAVVVTRGGVVVDSMGEKLWVRYAEGINSCLSAKLDFDRPVLWRQDEVLLVQFEEVDTNAAPTGDVTVIVAVERMRGRVKEKEEFRLVSDPPGPMFLGPFERKP